MKRKDSDTLAGGPSGQSLDRTRGRPRTSLVGLGHVALGHHAQANEQAGQGAAGFRLQAQGPRQVGVLEPAARLQGLRNALVGRVGGGLVQGGIHGRFSGGASPGL